MKSLSIILSIVLFSSINLAGQCLQGSYNLNGNTNDNSFNGYHGINHGAILTDDRKMNPNQAYYFDGDSAHINLGHDFDYDQRTVIVWFRADSIKSTFGTIYDSDHGSLLFGNTIIQVHENSGENFLRYQAGGSSANRHDENIDENIWYQAAIAVGADSVTYYLNCEVVRKFEMDSNSSSSGASFAILGCSRLFDRFFDGAIDDVQIHDCELTQSEICDNTALIRQSESTSVESRIFPNPASGSAVVEYENPSQTKVSINLYDNLGRMVYMVRTKSQNRTEIDLSNLEKGFYAYLITSEKEVLSAGKLIVK